MGRSGGRGSSRCGTATKSSAAAGIVLNAEPRAVNGPREASPASGWPAGELSPVGGRCDHSGIDIWIGRVRLWSCCVEDADGRKHGSPVQALQLLHAGRRRSERRLFGVQLRLREWKVHSREMMLEPSLSRLIHRALQGLEYGHVQLVVHEGQLVRIERGERVRLSAEGAKLETTPTGSTGGDSKPLGKATPSGREQCRCG